MTGRMVESPAPGPSDGKGLRHVLCTVSRGPSGTEGELPPNGDLLDDNLSLASFGVLGSPLPCWPFPGPPPKQSTYTQITTSPSTSGGAQTKTGKQCVSVPRNEKSQAQRGSDAIFLGGWVSRT